MSSGVCGLWASKEAKILPFWGHFTTAAGDVPISVLKRLLIVKNELSCV